MIEDTISTKKAGLLLYSMQLALTNVGQTTFGKAKDEEMVRDTVEEEEALREEARSSRHSVFSEKQNQHQHQRPFTTEGTEDTEEIGSSGQRGMDADERGLESGIKPVEWRPSADMYRMDTREGMEAYEARFRMKIEPRVAGEPRPVQPMITPEDPAQVHANLG